MKKSELKKEIRNSILENKSKDIDEMSTSGGAGAYNTPYAFKLKKKDKDLSEDLSRDKRDALLDLQDILDRASQLGEEAKGIVEDHFPQELRKGEAYDIFNFGSSANQYDNTLESFIRDIEQSADEYDGDELDGRDDLNENLNPEVTKKVNQFIKAMAKRYGYSEDDAIFAIQTALKQRGSNINEVSDIKMGHLATNDDGVKKPIYLDYGYKLVDKSKS